MLFGLIVGEIISFFGSITVGAIFADKASPSKEVFFWAGSIALVGTIIVAYVLMLYFFKKSM
jgi:membrane protein DedA with SNARE-associated domain